MGGDIGTLVDVLDGEVGYRERGTNDTKYNRWLGRIPGYAHNGYGYPWCASFAAWAYAEAGLEPGEDVPRTASCLVGVAWYRNRDRWGWRQHPRIGAQVFYGSNGGTHTEIVVDVDATHITTIGGNTSGSLGGRYYNGDGVYRKDIRRDEPRIFGYGYPRNLEEDDMSAKDVWNYGIRTGDGDGDVWRASTVLGHLEKQQDAIDAKIDALVARNPVTVDPSAVAAEVLRVLTPAAIASAIPAGIAAQVVDELKARL